MQAMMINSYDNGSQFVATDITKPTAGEGQVLVNIKATSVNTVDTMIRNMGADLAPISPELPALLGMDFAGVIEAVGANVSDYQVGDEVYGCAGGLSDLPGALAEYMVADARLVAHKPKTLSMREAAAIPLVGITTFEGLTRANLSANQKVLIQGGAGGVGHIAVQLANHLGADVYATVGGDADERLVKELGATPINYKAEAVSDYVEKHTKGKGFDVIFDTVGNQNLLKSFEAAALNAQVSTTTTLLELDLSGAHLKGLSLNVVFMLIPMLHNHQREVHGDILRQLAEIADAGKLKPIVDEAQFGLEDASKAHDKLTSGKATGKVVIDI